ncbi:hypothetical protein EDB89DRAFT_821886 [Lactarius sanguifluus]|nr:hypothetical protein EDB89DRAFT_821886 [Lactarius sanguifluus]
MHRHGSSSSSRPPNRTALRSRTVSSAKTTRARAACPRSLPRKRASSPPERAKLRVGVCGGTLDATVDALAVSGVTLELVVGAAFARGFLSAERAGGGKRREGEREGECGWWCEREREEEGGHRERELARVRGGERGDVEELGETGCGGGAVVVREGVGALGAQGSGACGRGGAPWRSVGSSVGPRHGWVRGCVRAAKS